MEFLSGDYLQNEWENGSQNIHFSSRSDQYVVTKNAQKLKGFCASINGISAGYLICGPKIPPKNSNEEIYWSMLNINNQSMKL